MRPAGEVRQLLAQVLAEAGRPITTREAAQRARTSVDLARTTIDNMVRGGAARRLEPIRVPGVKRPVPVYALLTLEVA